MARNRGKAASAPTTSCDVYIAGPLFKPEQLAHIGNVEALLTKLGLTFFSPVRGDNSRRMNDQLGLRREWLAARGFGPGQPRSPDIERSLEQELPVAPITHAVFLDNVTYAETCRLMLAHTDDFDPGTMWEMGAAYAYGVPVISSTILGYGTNLMLVHSVVAHCKGLGEIEEALRLAKPMFDVTRDTRAVAEATARLQARFLGKQQAIENEGSLRR